uniref:1-alkyl-2-acetylglycerophosphocholine esterase n=1 Tax=Rhodosorus marinus TaxID=101924 RepID=A0A7S0BP24_9RHOD
MDQSGFVLGLPRVPQVTGVRRNRKVAKMSLAPIRGGCSVGLLDLELPKGKGRGPFLARVFYPTDEEVGTPVRWIPDGGVVSKYFSKFFVGLPEWVSAVLGCIFAWVFGRAVIPDTYYGARVMKPKKKFPTIIFSHGLNGDRFIYTALCRSMASDGNIVFALEHRDGSAPSTIVTDGKTFERTEIEYRMLPKDSTIESAHEFRSEMLGVRVQEIDSVVCYVKELADGVEPLNLLDPEGKYRELLSSFAGKIDPHKLSLVGHSFGGTTTLLCCANHPNRYRSCVLHDPWMYPLPDSLKAEDGPELGTRFMMVLNELSVWPDNNEVVNKIAQRAPNGEFVTLKNASHHAQCDVAVMIGPLIAKAMKISANGEDFEPLYKSIAASLEFFRKHSHGEGFVPLTSDGLEHVESYRVEKKTRELSHVQARPTEALSLA